jgi:hypothetical protein
MIAHSLEIYMGSLIFEGVRRHPIAVTATAAVLSYGGYQAYGYISTQEELARSHSFDIRNSVAEARDIQTNLNNSPLKMYLNIGEWQAAKEFLEKNKDPLNVE